MGASPAAGKRLAGAASAIPVLNFLAARTRSMRAHLHCDQASDKNPRTNFSRPAVASAPNKNAQAR